MTSRTLSDAIGERFLGCMDSIRSLHEQFVREEASPDRQAQITALMDAVRTCMTALVAYFARHGNKSVTDKQLREVLHAMLEMSIEDYQANERLHVLKGD